MAAPLKKQAAWYDFLTEEQSVEVAVLETVIEGAEKAADAARARRQVLQHRAQSKEQVSRRQTGKLFTGLPRNVTEPVTYLIRLVATRDVRLGSRLFSKGETYDILASREIPLGFERETLP